jgi:hypothetical protein
MNIENFIANGLWDKDSTSIGDLGNDIGHPKEVPSRLSSSITRDKGTHFDFPK